MIATENCEVAGRKEASRTCETRRKYRNVRQGSNDIKFSEYKERKSLIKLYPIAIISKRFITKRAFLV